MTFSESPRIVYIGAERVGLACLRRLRELNKNIVGVITADDSLREHIADWTPFDGFTEGTGIPLYKVRSTKHEETIRLVQSLRPDVVCVVSWSMIVPPEILKIPPRGCVGFHYAMLPRRRGGAPLNWAIIDGLKETGITLFYLDDGIDSGDIIDQRAFPIAETDTVKDLLDKIMVIAPQLLAKHIDGIEAGTAPRVPQDESLATYTKRRRPEDGEIDWSKPERDIYNFIRALAPPYPCAFSTIGERRLVFTSARLVDGRLRFEGRLE
jgi:methionyl-tRNA formyltransferase